MAIIGQMWLEKVLIWSFDRQGRENEEYHSIKYAREMWNMMTNNNAYVRVD